MIRIVKRLVSLCFLYLTLGSSVKAQSGEFYNVYLDANTLLAKGQFDKAINLYNQALKLHQADYVYLNRGNCFFGKKDLKNALVDYNKTLSMNKEYYEAFCQRGLLKLQTGDVSACDDLKKAARENLKDASKAVELNCGKKKK